MREIHYIAGIPRSGSTLLCNVLAQNPRFHPTSSSGLYDTLINIRNFWHKVEGHITYRDDGAMRRFLHVGMYQYHNTDRPVVFDKGRAMMENVDFFEYVMGKKAKIIMTLRPIDEVLASYEKLFRKNAAVRQPPHHVGQNYQHNNTAEKRAAFLMDDSNIVGRNLNRIKELELRPDLEDRFCKVWYDDFMGNPEATLCRIYDFLEEEYYQHDFSNVEQYTKEDDFLNGHPGLHTVRPIVKSECLKSEDYIGKEAAGKYKGLLVKPLIQNTLTLTTNQRRPL